MKYIDADRLKEAVEKKYNSNDTVGDRWDLGYDTACEQILDIIDTLQQEQPEVDLEKEIDRLWESFADEMEGPHNLFDIYSRLARHFYKLGKEGKK